MIVNPMAPCPTRLRDIAAVLAFCTGSVGWMATGLLSALPAAAGLSLLAVPDFATHRFSVRALGVGTCLVVLAMAVDSVLSDSWDRMAVAAAGAATLAGVLFVAWVSTSGIAFGDVLLVTFALAVPLYLSIAATAVTVVATLVVAAAYVAARAIRRGVTRSTGVPLGPALLAGWLCGVMVA